MRTPTGRSTGIDAEAAAWLARLHGPDRRAETDAALKGWLKTDTAHEEAFERATEIWDKIPGAASAGVAVRHDPRESPRAALTAASASAAPGPSRA